MRNRVWTTMAIAAMGVALADATPATASENTAADTKPWTVAFETASAAGTRWLEQPTGWDYTMVLSGTLSNTGDGCYSLWSRFWHDWSGTQAKQLEICGPGSVDVNVLHTYDVETTGQIAICKGTADATNCGAWVDVTFWSSFPTPGLR